MESETTEQLESRAVDLIMGIEDDAPQEAAPEDAQDEITDQEGDAEGSEDDALEADSEGEQEEPEEEAGPDDLVEFEFEGQLIEAPLVIKEALMRQSDYTQKTQDLSARSKAMEIMQAEIEASKQHYEFAQTAMPEVLKAQQLDTNIGELNRYLRENIESLPHSETMKIQLAIDDAKKERDDIVGSITSKQQEFQQAQEQSRAELLNQGTEVLRSKFSNWGAESQKQVRDYSLNVGFTEAEIASVIDPRQVEVLYKASLYDDMVKNKPGAVRQVQKAPRIASKSRNPMSPETQSKLNLKKTLKSNKISQRAKKQAVIDDIGNRWG